MIVFDKGGLRLHHGDCLDVLPGLPDGSVDAVVTDPPYSYAFMNRAWDAHDSPEAFGQWCRAWAAECLRLLKPGGHLLAFGGTRTYHRLASGIEDAGFEIRHRVVTEFTVACIEPGDPPPLYRTWAFGPRGVWIGRAPTREAALAMHDQALAEVRSRTVRP